VLVKLPPLEVKATVVETVVYKDSLPLVSIVAVWAVPILESFESKPVDRAASDTDVPSIAAAAVAATAPPPVLVAVAVINDALVAPDVTARLLVDPALECVLERLAANNTVTVISPTLIPSRKLVEEGAVAAAPLRANREITTVPAVAGAV
jgi:hypothetical protein